MNNLNRARAYLAKLPPSVSGQGGHPALFKAACWAVRFGLGDGDAMALLREWNGTHCQPKWTEKELAHKLKDARRAASCQPIAEAAPSVRLVWKLDMRPRVVCCETAELPECNKPAAKAIYDFSENLPESQKPAARHPNVEPAAAIVPDSKPDVDESSTSPATVEPYATPAGDLFVPFNSEPRFHYWKKRDENDGILTLGEIHSLTHKN